MLLLNDHHFSSFPFFTLCLSSPIRFNYHLFPFILPGLGAVSVMVLIGDTFHNITDGMAIGVAFTLDIYVGISTCIAVFCHELPHEIGTIFHILYQIN